MKEYQPRKNNKYYLPTPIYNTTINYIRSYYVWKDEYDSIPGEGKSVTDYDGMPHGTPSFDSMDKKVIRMDKLKQDIDLIDNAMMVVPQEYRSGVWRNIQYSERFPCDANRSTYSRYKSKVIKEVATQKKFI